MATRAADKVTLQVLPTPTYVRQYFVLQESTLGPPAAPVGNPPAAPWEAAEPTYVAGSTMTLYTCMLTVWGNGTHQWGERQVSSSYEAAKQAYNLAFAASRTVDGMRRVVASVSEPAAPGDGWMNGDQWWQYSVEPVTGRNRLENIWIWNGSNWALFQFIADSVLVPSSVGNVLLAEGAVDAMTIRGAQIYGGYIEAPVIASSANLGTGANALNDPGFASTINTAWVASGHLGDAARTQRDSYWWDQTYSEKNLYPDVWVVARNRGNSHVDLTLTPPTRTAGSLVFANYGWVPADRVLTDPFTFTNSPDWLSQHSGGANDPSWAAPNAPTPLAGVARTTYLTNSAVVAVQAGQRWNARLTFNRFSQAQTVLADLTLEVINASSSVVLWSVLLTPEEKMAGQVNAWWDADFTGNVKYRIKTVYTAAGGTVARKPVLGGTASKVRDGVTQFSWAAAADDVLPYKGSVSKYSYGVGDSAISLRAGFRVTAASAMFSQVQPTQGWRLTEDGGLELFNSLGARTAQLDGQSNFMSGEVATAESGARLLMIQQRLEARSATDALLGSLGVVDSRLRLLAANGRPTDTPIVAKYVATASIPALSSSPNVGTPVLSTGGYQSAYSAGLFTPGAHSLTVTEAGVYEFKMRAAVPAVGAGRSFVQITGPGNTDVTEFGPGTYNLTGGWVGQLAAGDTVTFCAYQSTGAARTAPTYIDAIYHGPRT